MSKFVKSLLVGVVASLIIIGGVVGAGVWLSSGGGSAILTSSMANDDKPRLVRMEPQKVHLGGFSLNSRKQAKELVISVAMSVTGSQNQMKVCRLMPRLVSSLNAAFANLASYGDDARAALSGNLTGQLRSRFNRALGENLVGDVRLTAYQNKDDVPATNCPEET